MGLFANIAFTWFRARASVSFFDRISTPNGDTTRCSNLGLEWQHDSSPATVDTPNSRRLSYPTVATAPLSPLHTESLLPASPPPATATSVSKPFRSVKSKALFDVENSGLESTRPVRLVISGRMADVCAELERLAALETQQPIKVLH